MSSTASTLRASRSSPDLPAPKLREPLPDEYTLLASDSAVSLNWIRCTGETRDADVSHSVADDHPSEGIPPNVPFELMGAHSMAGLTELVGISMFPASHDNHRDVISLRTIDVELSDPGTEVTVTWGDSSGEPSIERHVETEIGAQVSPTN